MLTPKPRQSLLWAAASLSMAAVSVSLPRIQVLSTRVPKASRSCPPSASMDSQASRAAALPVPTFSILKCPSRAFCTCSEVMPFKPLTRRWVGRIKRPGSLMLTSIIRMKLGAASESSTSPAAFFSSKYFKPVS